MKYYSSQQNGLTLIETLVAVFIFSLSLVSLMVISARGIQSITVASQRAIGQFLAQEGVEIVEAIRDDNFININTIDWMANLDDCLNQTCFIAAYDFHGGSIAPNSCGGQCPELYADQGAGYQYDQGDPTPFIRSIMIEGEPAEDSVRVISTVEWSRANVPYSVSVEKYMTRWFQSSSS